MSYNPLVRGINTNISARQTSTGYQNGMIVGMNAASPVSTNINGEIIYLDTTNEASVEGFVGLTQTTIRSGVYGQVVSDGRLENIPTTLGFSIGDAIYAGPTPGTLTNVKPDLSVSGWVEGMFVVFIGVVVMNQFNASGLDIQLSRVLVGQL